MTPYILLLIGLILIALEFYLPSGVLAIVAALFVLVAQASFYAAYSSILASLVFFVVSIALVIGVVYIAITLIRKSGAKNSFFLSKDQQGYTAAGFDEKMIGKHGVALTDFGPSGYVLIEGGRYPAVCRGGYLNKGTDVIVIAGDSGHLVIKAQK